MIELSAITLLILSFSTRFHIASICFQISKESAEGFFVRIFQYLITVMIPEKMGLFTDGLALLFKTLVKVLFLGTSAQDQNLVGISVPLLSL